MVWVFIGKLTVEFVYRQGLSVFFDSLDDFIDTFLELFFVVVLSKCDTVMIVVVFVQYC